MKINVKVRSMGRGMELNGDKLSGDTYPAREVIKNHWDGEWDGATKTWAVDPEKVTATISDPKWTYSRYFEISEQQPVNRPASRADGRTSADGWCDKCQSWCFGECSR
jgi:hypothetical protein